MGPPGDLFLVRMGSRMQVTHCDESVHTQHIEG